MLMRLLGRLWKRTWASWMLVKSIFLNWARPRLLETWMWRALVSVIASPWPSYSVPAATATAGVSGGALAAIFGLYERMISFLANVTKDFKRKPGPRDGAPRR